ncbi:Arrestin-C domain-containing protein [Fusarium keratoplasticum]|nr:Arrestin-C domain-containing protein [Fusarium keratoplasticum]
MALSLVESSLIFKLAVGLPLFITINTNIPFAEQRSGSNHLTLGPFFEADTMSPPGYGEHILDQLFDDLPHEEVQSTGSLPATTGDTRQNQEFGGQEMTVPSSSEPFELDSAEMEELSQIPSYQTALRTPLRFRRQPGNIQLPAYDAAARSNRQDQID